MGLFDRLLADRSLRPEKRSNSLVSMANSLALIAKALKVIVQREYHVEIDAPEPSRADLTREVWEPMYSNNADEAIREERERIEAAEADASASGSGKRDVRAAELRRLALSYEARGGADSDQLTPEESRFLAELDTEHDER